MKKSLFEILVAFNLYIGGLKLHKAKDRTKEKCQTMSIIFPSILEFLYQFASFSVVLSKDTHAV